MDVSLVLLVAPDCHECEKVLAYVSEHNIEIRTINLETQDERVKKQILIYPALCDNDKIIAYGTDILKYLSKSI